MFESSSTSLFRIPLKFIINSEEFPPEVQGLGLKVLTDREFKERACQALPRAGEQVRCPAMLHNTNHTRRDLMYSALAGDPETISLPCPPPH